MTEAAYILPLGPATAALMASELKPVEACV
jgi:hypothetical protein